MSKDYAQWHLPFAKDDISLDQANNLMHSVKADPDEVPIMVQLVENPKYQIPGFSIFHGAVDLQQHDFIHIILGRGLLPLDEAFTIGFTMGSTKKVSTTEEALFTTIAKYLYPSVYQFDDDAIRVFRDAVRLAYISDCVALDEFDFHKHKAKTLAEIRSLINLESELILAYYQIEKKRFPDSIASQRLLNKEY